MPYQIDPRTNEKIYPGDPRASEPAFNKETQFPTTTTRTPSRSTVGGTTGTTGSGGEFSMLQLLLGMQAVNKGQPASAFNILKNPEPTGAKQSTALRKEFRQETNDIQFKKVRSSYQTVAASKETAAGDLSMIFAFMKILDPGSVVRESEFKTAESAQRLIDRTGIPLTADRAVRLYKGERLSPNARQDFQSQAALLYNERVKQQQEINDFYSELARDAGLNPQDVIGAVGDVSLINVEPGDEAEEEQDRGLLYNLFVKPYVTTAGNLGALGQVGASSLASKFNPELGAKLADPNLLGQNVRRRSELASEKPLQAGLQQGGASLSIAGQASLLKTLGLDVGLGSLAKGKLVNPRAGTGLLGKLTGRAAAKTGAAGVKTGAGRHVVKGAEKIRGFHPKAVLAKRQAEAAAKTVGKVKPDVSKLVKVGEKLAKQDPAVAREFAKQKSFITAEKIKDIPDLLERMQLWGRTAYLKGGGIKAAGKANLYDGFYKEGIRQLQTLAPEVYEQRQLLRLAFELPKAAGKALWKLTLGRILIS